jgi:hypothetical protein
VATETILSSEHVSLLYHPDTKIVHHEFKQFVFGEQFRAVLMAGLEIMRANGASKWLSDDRGNSSLSQEDQDWADRVWLPAVMAAGWKYWAVVMPANVVGQMNIRKWAEKFRGRGVTAMVFTDPDAALKWLDEQAD